MAFADELVIGFAELLGEVDGLVWSLAEYGDTGTEVPIYIPNMPHDRDRAVALTPYPVEDSAGDSADVWAVQVRIRGNPDDFLSVTSLEDLIFRAVNGREDVMLGSIHATLVWRNSSMPMGMDANRRHEWSSNFYMHITRPTTYRAD